MMILKRFTPLLLLLFLSLSSCKQNTAEQASETEIQAETEQTEEVQTPSESDKPEIVHEVVTEVGSRYCQWYNSQLNRLTYLDFWDESAYITLDQNTLNEYYSEKHFYLKANLNWTSDCTYDATIEVITIPFTDLKVGDVMSVEILQTRGDTVYLKSTYGDDTNYVTMLRG